MTEQTIPAVLSVDLKKYRIRIFKTVLHEMGDPMNVQLLVNPDAMLVAIRSVEKKASGDQTHTVGRLLLSPSANCDIYSRVFVMKLREVSKTMQEGHSYRLAGEVIPAQKVAVFDLKTLEEIDV